MRFIKATHAIRRKGESRVAAFFVTNDLVFFFRVLQLKTAAQRDLPQWQWSYVGCSTIYGVVLEALYVPATANMDKPGENGSYGNPKLANQVCQLTETGPV